MSDVPRRVLILQSFCENNPDCTDRLPCRDCLGLCHTATVTGPLTPDDADCLDHQRVRGE